MTGEDRRLVVQTFHATSRSKSDGWPELPGWWCGPDQGFGTTWESDPDAYSVATFTTRLLAARAWRKVYGDDVRGSKVVTLAAARETLAAYRAERDRIKGQQS